MDVCCTHMEEIGSKTSDRVFCNLFGEMTACQTKEEQSNESEIVLDEHWNAASANSQRTATIKIQFAAEELDD